MKFDLNRLKAERVAKGFTQQDLADALGISRTAYWKKESGDSDIGLEQFLKILQILGLSKQDLPIFFANNVDKRERKEK